MSWVLSTDFRAHCETKNGKCLLKNSHIDGMSWLHFGYYFQREKINGFIFLFALFKNVSAGKSEFLYMLGF